MVDNEKEFKFILHLETFDENLKNPGYDEDNDPDYSFLDNVRYPIFFDCLTLLRIYLSDMLILSESKVETLEELSLSVQSKNTTYKLKFITDPEQHLIEDSSRRDELKKSSSSKEEDRRWWIKSVTLPDDSELVIHTANRNITKQDLNVIESSILSEFQNEVTSC